MLLLKMIGKAKYTLLCFMDKEDLKTFLLEMSFSCFSLGNVIFLFFCWKCHFLVCFAVGFEISEVQEYYPVVLCQHLDCRNQAGFESLRVH